MRAPGIGRALAVGLAAATLGALASLAPIAPADPTCAAAGANHAAVVVEHGDGSVTTRCVAFATTTVTGTQLLTLSGIAWSSQTFGGFGDAVCALDGEPARYLECPGKDSYWAVFVASAGGSWRLASVGISSLALRDGDAEGFRYVPAAGNPVAPVSPAGVCAAPATAKPAPATARPAAVVSPTASAAPSSASTTPQPSVSASVPLSVEPTALPSEAATNAVAPIDAATPPTPTPRSADPPSPAPPGGPDSGLVAASVAGVALAGLAVLGFIARRRRRL
jgi:hypothetical protein